MKYCDKCRSSYPNEFNVCPIDNSALRVTSELIPGMTIRDKYLILDKVGEGGMGAVYRARHLAFNEIRALKVVHQSFAEDRAFIKRFKTEAPACMAPAMPNGRCRMHGGASTGPRTAAGLARSMRANWKHGGFSAEAKHEANYFRQLLRTCKERLADIRATSC